MQLGFRGETLEGFGIDDVKRSLGQLMRFDEARQTKLFSRKKVVLKRSVAAADARRYVSRLRTTACVSWPRPLRPGASGLPGAWHGCPTPRPDLRWAASSSGATGSNYRWMLKKRSTLLMRMGSQRSEKKGKTTMQPGTRKLTVTRSPALPRTPTPSYFEPSFIRIAALGEDNPQAPSYGCLQLVAIPARYVRAVAPSTNAYFECTVRTTTGSLRDHLDPFSE